jgi:hypothetical protein
VGGTEREETVLRKRKCEGTGLEVQSKDTQHLVCSIYWGERTCEGEMGETKPEGWEGGEDRVE